MHIAGAQHERMLQNKGRDPHTVRRDGSALLPQLPKNRSVMMRSLFIGVEHSDAGPHQKAPQHCFVARSLIAHDKSRTQFSQHDEGQPDLVRDVYKRQID